MNSTGNSIISKYLHNVEFKVLHYYTNVCTVIIYNSYIVSGLTENSRCVCIDITSSGQSNNSYYSPFRDSLGVELSCFPT